MVSPGLIPVAATAADACLGSADEAALLACRQGAYADASQRLRQAVDKLRQRYQDDEPERATLLSTAQRAWRRYQAAECRFRHVESKSGRAYQAYLLACLTELSERRLQDLQDVLATP